VLTEAVWKQYAMQVFGSTVSRLPSFWRKGESYGIQIGTTLGRLSGLATPFFQTFLRTRLAALTTIRNR